MPDPASAPTKIFKILIVDDHPIVRRGLRELLADEADMDVCGEAEDVAGAMQQVRDQRPDAIVIDLSLKGGHGLELIQEVKSAYDEIRMLVSSMHDESLFAERALRAGATGYISKQESPDKIIGALRQILRGEIFLSPRMANRLLHRLTSGQSCDTSPIESLTDRELEVFEMIGQGLGTKEIARRLDLSHKTIEAHREKIKAKLNLRSGTELGRHATQWVLENN